MQYSISDIQAMAVSIAASLFFRSGKEKKPLSPDQILTLLLISAAEGKHPALGVKDYEIVDGRPSKKTDSMLRDLLLAGGSVIWHALTDVLASATFSHPQGGTVKIDWDIERVKKAGLIGKDNWQKYRRQMLRSRCVSEGVRTVYPSATSAMYCPEELRDLSDDAPPKMGLSIPIVTPSIDELAESLASDIASSFDLEATYAAHSDTLQRVANEKPEWLEPIQNLFYQRDEEIKKNTAQAV